MHQPIGPVGAGFLGAGLALAVAIALIGTLFFFGFLQFGRERRNVKAGEEKA